LWRSSNKMLLTPGVSGRELCGARHNTLNARCEKTEHHFDRDRKARKETRTLAESYLKQQLHGGAVSGGTSPPPKLSGETRATSQQTQSPATPLTEQKHEGSPGAPLVEARQARALATSPDKEVYRGTSTFSAGSSGGEQESTIAGGSSD